MKSAVAIVSPTLSGFQRSRIDAASTELGIACVLARDVASLLDAPPQIHRWLFVGGIRPGERQLPRTIVELCDAYPGSAVLLLSSEPLVSPSVCLEGGHVVLLPPPHDEAMLKRHIGQLLPRSSDRVKEHLSPVAWLATLGDGVALHDDGGGWKAEMGTETAPRSIELSAGATQWRFSWGGRGGALWLLSNARIPHQIELVGSPATPELGDLTLPARSGDVVVASPQDIEPSSVSFERVVEEGGPGVLRHLQSTVAQDSRWVVIEVR